MMGFLAAVLEPIRDRWIRGKRHRYVNRWEKQHSRRRNFDGNIGHLLDKNAIMIFSSVPDVFELAS